MMNDGSGKGNVKVQIASCQHLARRDAQACIHVLDIRKAFDA
jgi:hypothetical protein